MLIQNNAETLLKQQSFKKQLHFLLSRQIQWKKQSSFSLSRQIMKKLQKIMMSLTKLKLTKQTKQTICKTRAKPKSKKSQFICQKYNVKYNVVSQNQLDS